MAEQMDRVPNALFRLVQMGEVDRAMRSEAIWLCVSCFTCTARCPQSVDCVGIIDALRQMAAEQDALSPAQKRVYVFQKAFLDSVRRNGRINEVEMIVEFKTRGFLNDFSVPLLLKDSLMAPKLMQHGKFHLMGEKVRDRAVVRRIFDRCMQYTLDVAPATANEASHG
jgi:heterodisulfide reductase subunit C